MNNLWIGLRKANARAVFFCLLAALAVVTAWWAWKLNTPIRVTPSPVTITPQEPALPDLGLLAYLRAQQAIGTNRAASLFFPATSSPPPPSSVKPDKPESPTPPPRKDPIKPAPARVTLTYQGLMMRADGIPMALITDSRSQHAAFYAQGTNLFSLIITSIEPESLGARLPDQSPATLKRGVPQSFPEKPNAD